MHKLLLIACLFLTCNADIQMTQRSKVMMGTFVSVSVERGHKELIKQSFEIIKGVESSLSSYKKTSPIAKLNKNKEADLDAYSYESLKLSLQYYNETGGYFDIAVGKITKDLYHFGEKERVASSKELQKSSTSIGGLVFDKSTAYINNTIKIDLGGMGKGFGVDKVSAFLVKNSVKKAVIALSGDIRCIGTCKIAVNNPLDANQPLALFTMNNSGVSTSGNYNRYIKSPKYNHLINPKTKQSEQNFFSVTLVSNLPSATLDAYATAVSVMPVKKAYAFLNSQPLAYIILQADKKLIVSQNIIHYISDLKLK
ncbi:FAD:protein FMN transferase [Sulfurimonas autotrophica]|uniref:FAD:protein FMN transferase n=1 Tax=Sulfurimonas autotrophica (strain ATCC BAA-671 / DSM 16294 / JCM 11897 / OK10) TaxID=563040 RepID=E0USB8_SULAO|nr:FAD:protein FMN transferase [Sulfurimonas autotrophica]ADN09081.1 ApbE family lipoprotein [Sulfurimonas autotrophica DSM 16294]